jgi:uncharacterized integral membrane protein
MKLAGQDSIRYIVIFQMALFTLCAIAIVTLCGSFILAFNHMQVPDSIVAMGGAAVGALAGLFAPSPLTPPSA